MRRFPTSAPRAARRPAWTDIYLHQFRSLEEARPIIADFVARYNTEWLIERLGHRTPAQARAEAHRRAA
jgi:transposase InsO family protein